MQARRTVRTTSSPCGSIASIRWRIPAATNVNINVVLREIGVPSSRRNARKSSWPWTTVASIRRQNRAATGTAVTALSNWLINERFRRWQQATGGTDLELGFYCCSLNKYLRFPDRTELPRADTLQSYLAAHCVEEGFRARRGWLLEAVLRLTSKRDRLLPL